MQKKTLCNERTWSLYCGQVHTGSDRFGQVRIGVNRYFSSTVSHTLSNIGPPPKTCLQFSNRTSLETLWPSEVVETALRHASIGLRCELEWSATFLGSTSKSNISLESSQLSEFECESFFRIGPKTKKLWLSIIPALRRSYQPRLGQPQNGVNYHFSLPHLDRLFVVGKLLISEAQKCSFSRIGQEINKLQLF